MYKFMRKNPKYSVRLQSQIYIKNINSKVYKVTDVQGKTSLSYLSHKLRRKILEERNSDIQILRMLINHNLLTCFF